MENTKNFIRTASGCIFTVEEYKHNMLEQLENNFDGETFDSVRAAEQYAEELWDYDEAEVIDENGEKVSEEETDFEFVNEYDAARTEYIKAALKVVTICED